MKDELMRNLDFLEIEDYNNINNHVFKLKEYANGVSGIFGELRYKAGAVDGELDEASMGDVTAIMNAVEYRIQTVFDDIDALGKDIARLTKEARELELTAIAEPPGEEDDTAPSDVEEWGDGE